MKVSGHKPVSKKPARTPSAAVAANGASDRSSGSTLFGEDSTTRFALIAYVVVVLWIALQPLAGDDLWWDLSRGREVLKGSIAPSRLMLELDDQSESDWLGGVIGFVSYAAFDSNGLMLFRCGFVVGVAFLLWRCVRDNLSTATFLLASLAVVCLLPAADSVSLVYDVLGAVATLWFADRWLLGGRSVSLLILLGVGLLWANLGAGYALFLPIVIGVAIGRLGESSVSQNGVIVALLLLAATAWMNPRGGLGILDSFQRIRGSLDVDVDVSGQGTVGVIQTWQTWSERYGVVVPLAFVILSVLAVGLQFCWLKRSPRRFWQLGSVWIAGQWLAWTSPANLSLAAVWIGMTCLSARLPADRAAKGSVTRWKRGLLPACCLVLVGIAAVKAPADMGWGIDEQQDFRYLQSALPAVLPVGTGWADSLRSGGMIAWINPEGVRLQDLPHRAMLGGRLRQQHDIARDLAEQRKTSYYRSNGSQGGWWLSLQDRQTQLLLVEADNVELIAALEPTLWKPLTLDSPVVAYASTGNSAYSNRILETLQQRHFVDRGPWSYQRPQSTGSPFDRDRFGLAIEGGAIGQSIRQAEVFTAMELPNAAMRILHAEQLRSGAEPAEAIARCQMMLLHREYKRADRCSQFQALATTLACQRAGIALADAFPLPDLSECSDAMRGAVQLYLDGRWREAIELLGVGGLSDQDRYGLAILLLQLGDLDDGRAVLAALAESDDSALRLLASEALASLEFDLAS
ncbi:hypothetical protein [Rosistilla oblonga]|uniref:Glycosyltransferase RgtA/B/C/D-like domain-containing protein n=1 Tax=Rosistilla oblonga TaxID=2527990 RepID=A0A518ING8_9BACT|nr:hypothetical protein [Rosistilla oblonga]QDV54630.1 hypothetical protein Mal33_05850 [Rosistilla oblonga]